MDAGSPLGRYATALSAKDATAYLTSDGCKTDDGYWNAVADGQPDASRNPNFREKVGYEFHDALKAQYGEEIAWAAINIKLGKLKCFALTVGDAWRVIAAANSIKAKKESSSAVDAAAQKPLASRVNVQLDVKSK